MRKTKSRRPTAVSHAMTVARLSPGIASRRLAALSFATPVQAVSMLANMASEKTFAYAQAYANSLVAIGAAQMSLLRLATDSTTPNDAVRASEEAMTVLFRSGSEIARTALAPFAQRVARNHS